MSQHTCGGAEDDGRFHDENASVSSVISSIADHELSKRRFTKLPELVNYFDSIGSSTICRACNKHFSSRSYARLLGHLNKCKSFEGREDVHEMITREELPFNKQSMNDLWAAAILDNNISFSTSESKSFRKLATTLSRGSWTPPSRDELSSVIIPNLSREANRQFINKVRQSKEQFLTIEFDHWKDAADRSLLGVVASTINGTRHLVDLIDTSLDGHGGEASLKHLKTALAALPATSINSVISDSGSGCRKARRDFRKLDGFSHVIEIRCLAHLFNNIGSRITSEDTDIKESIAKAMKITSFFASSSYWQARFTNLKLPKIKLATPTRWYSLVNQLTGLVAWKDVIYEHIASTLNSDQRKVLSEFDWHQLDRILKVLKPINYTIGQLEARNVNLGGAFKVILDIARQLFDDRGQPSKELIHARKCFLWYFSPKKIAHEDLGLYIASYAIDPRFNLKYLTEDAVDLTLEGLLSVALLSDLNTKRRQQNIVQEFELYIKGTGGYQRHDRIDDPVSWWKLQQKSGPLAQVALRLLHLKASSTNVERAFSTLRGIVGMQRCRLLATSMLHMCRMKILSYPIKIEDTPLYESYQEADTSFDSSQNDSSSQDFTSIDRYPMWIDDHETDLIASYNRLMKLFDFKRESDSSGAGIDPVMSSRDVKELVKKARIEREQLNHGVSIDTDELMIELDAQIISQEPLL